MVIGIHHDSKTMETKADHDNPTCWVSEKKECPTVAVSDADVNQPMGLAREDPGAQVAIAPITDDKDNRGIGGLSG